MRSAAPGSLPPTPPPPRSFTTNLLALPPELQTRIFTFLSPHDLGVLSRCVPELEGVERDRYLRREWFRRVRRMCLLASTSSGCLSISTSSGWLSTSTSSVWWVTLGLAPLSTGGSGSVVPSLFILSDTARNVPRNVRAILTAPTRADRPGQTRLGFVLAYPREAGPRRARECGTGRIGTKPLPRRHRDRWTR